MSRPALKSVPRRSAPPQPERCWKVTVARRDRGFDSWESLLVIAVDVHDAIHKMLEHCATPGLDLEVTAVERLPSGVITRSTAKHGKAA